MEKVYEYAAAVLAEVKRAIAGKDACITKAFATILAGGHILIEDVPGVGKTTLAIAFRASWDFWITVYSLHRTCFRQIL